jgi:hypothetical protein
LRVEAHEVTAAVQPSDRIDTHGHAGNVLH